MSEASRDQKKIYASVALHVPLAKPLTYAVPDELIPCITPGVMVGAPLGKKMAAGYVIETSATTDVPDPKAIVSLYSDGPLFNLKDLEFYRWAAEYYEHPLGTALKEIIPLRGRKGRIPARRKKTEVEAPVTETEGLSPLSRDHMSKAGRPRLNGKQREAAAAIGYGIESGVFSTFLLHGVTGSGKTEVYLRVIESALRKEYGIIYLVPEIALTPQLIGRIRERFPGEPFAVLHSGLTPASRHRQWRLIQDGRIGMVLGARSAVFAPVKNLRLIIVDEEHDSSYKQDERLKYNARDLAVIKGSIFGAQVVLGSATPDVQTYHNSKTNKYRYLSLPKRVLNRPLPEVEIVDLRRFKNDTLISPPLKEALEKNLSDGNQSILFLNRRGFNTLVICFSCGGVFRCRNCSVALTYHLQKEGRGPGALKCHHCDYSRGIVDLCPECRAGEIGKLGFGTERLEEELRSLFPLAKIGRMDSDTMIKREDYGKILADFQDLRIDILVGTQMIAKGHDFPRVTLIGVVLADASLNLPDFRAGERTFQLLTQVAGRGGRGDIPGRVIIQTFNPASYPILRAQDHDYEAFFKEETAARRALGYPPFGRLINLHLSGPSAEEGAKKVRELGRLAREICREDQGKVLVFGPAEAPLRKIRGRYRWQLLLKGQEIKILHELAREIRARADALRLEVKIDVDPINFF